MESTPAWVAQRMPWAPCAWAATLRPRRCASGHDGLELFLACIGEACGIVALGQHAAGGADLDEIGAVLDGPRAPLCCTASTPSATPPPCRR